MSFFSSPTSFRLNALQPVPHAPFVPMMYSTLPGNSSYDMTTIMMDGQKSQPAEGHPSLMHLGLLVFEAVMEVVCVSLPGYIIARAGLFDTDNQKFVANLNVSLFTPCLIFIKLASQLTLSKLAELIIIPVLFVFMTAVSYCCSLAVAKLFGFEKPARNFVIAMGVFGNSNSLPISLVLSLAHTISGLHWDRIPGDNDQEVAARGILYLLIFQQLGQLLRWSWGYHVLLARTDDVETGAQPNGSAGRSYRDNEDDNEGDSDSEDEDLLRVRVDPFMSPQFENSFEGLHRQVQPNEQDALLPCGHDRNHHRNHTTGTTDSAFESGPSGEQTPVSRYPSSASLSTCPGTDITQSSSIIGETPLKGNRGKRDITSFPTITTSSSTENLQPRWAAPAPQPWYSRTFTAIKNFGVRFALGLWEFMNPPLWAMFAAIIVASIPQLQELFFTKGTFVNASVTRAISQSGNVAVPLILVVLGANLANSTSGKQKNAHADKQETKILIASLVSRMLLPFFFIAPVLAIAAKYLNISILDDPIFLVVCFLLTGAPSALQLAQICQINNVFEDVITRVLFWSYVVVILPSTLALVITAIEVVHWAT
ncbi:auxin efflux carrier [Tricharina praecox]|uniref:auxin efflux carrier n=1 Tax=Tricharina praecox TaxID=43433 RepID=UPI002220C7D8|nr:auxin efflux carrier [Tricharina praecox]KAI5858649.1 auxin efflux carrier [Tricharina praecox]